MPKFTAGTQVPNSSDPRTVEQNAFIDANNMGFSTQLKPEFRGKALTPTGEVVTSTEITIPPSRESEINAIIAAGTDPSKPSGGYMLILNEDGIPIQYYSVYPTQETIVELRNEQKNEYGQPTEPAQQAAEQQVQQQAQQQSATPPPERRRTTDNTLIDYIKSELNADLVGEKNRLSFPTKQGNDNLATRLGTAVYDYLENEYLPRILQYLSDNVRYTDATGIGVDENHNVSPNPHSHLINWNIPNKK